MKATPDSIKALLQSIPGLPDFAVQAIVREVEASIAMWSSITPDDLIAEDTVAFQPLLAVDSLSTWRIAMQLIAEFAGQRVYVPKAIPNDHVIVRVVGEDGAKIVASTMGGSEVRFPKPDALLRRARDRIINKKYCSGCGVNQLAKEYGLLHHNVLNIVAHHRRR